MALLSATQKIIERVEHLTNRPVHIQEDDSLRVLAHIRVARGDAPLHLLRYKPAGTTPPDYLIAFQCGFVIRLFEAPPERRINHGPHETGRREIDAMLSAPRYEPIRSMAGQLLEGLVTQLLSVPIGLRVDDWLLTDYPELSELQAVGIRTQLEQGLQAVAIGSKGMFPTELWKINGLMNAASAAFWSRKWNDVGLSLPYKAAGLLDGGLSLLEIFDQVSTDPAQDPDLVEQWAVALGLNGWYVRTPYRLNEP
jgi:hypothetical protein